jgi:hypothetical protein
VKLPDGWREALDLLRDSAMSFDDSCFRSVELAWSHPDDVISGAGTRSKGEVLPRRERERSMRPSTRKPPCER